MSISFPAEVSPNAIAEPRHKPELDGIRGIAILAVLLSHAGPFIQRGNLLSRLLPEMMIPGWGGVELFFVLSGFLITGILLQTKAASNYFSAFYMRRFLRIFPIYYFALTSGLIVGHFSPFWHSLLPTSIKLRVAFYFYLQNWPLFWEHGQRLSGAFGHFWSLAVEEQFYLVWPVLIWMLSEKAVFRLCCVGLILALPMRIFLFHRYFGPDFGLMELTTSRVDGLLVGAALAIRLRKGPIPGQWIGSMFAIGGLILSFIALFHRSELTATNKFMHTIGVTGFALLSGAFLGLSQRKVPRLLRLLDAKWLRITGKYSYGIYVYHLPVYVVTGEILSQITGVRAPLPLGYALPYTLLLITLTFLVAKLSYDLFESKVLRLKKHFRPQKI